jgi:hypothetical protein
MAASGSSTVMPPVVTPFATPVATGAADAAYDNVPLGGRAAARGGGQISWWMGTAVYRPELLPGAVVSPTAIGVSVGMKRKRPSDLTDQSDAKADAIAETTSSASSDDVSVSRGCVGTSVLASELRIERRKMMFDDLLKSEETRMCPLLRREHGALQELLSTGITSRPWEAFWCFASQDKDRHRAFSPSVCLIILRLLHLNGLDFNLCCSFAWFSPDVFCTPLGATLLRRGYHWPQLAALIVEHATEFQIDFSAVAIHSETETADTFNTRCAPNLYYPALVVSTLRRANRFPGLLSILARSGAPALVAPGHANLSVTEIAFTSDEPPLTWLTAIISAQALLGPQEQLLLLPQANSKVTPLAALAESMQQAHYPELDRWNTCYYAAEAFLSLYKAAEAMTFVGSAAQQLLSGSLTIKPLQELVHSYLVGYAAPSSSFTLEKSAAVRQELAKLEYARTLAMENVSQGYDVSVTVYIYYTDNANWTRTILFRSVDTRQAMQRRIDEACKIPRPWALIGWRCSTDEATKLIGDYPVAHLAETCHARDTDNYHRHDLIVGVSKPDTEQPT